MSTMQYTPVSNRLKGRRSLTDYGTPDPSAVDGGVAQTPEQGTSSAPADSTSIPYQPSATGFPLSMVNSSEPGKMAEQDRQVQYLQGNDIDTKLQNRASSSERDEGYFRQEAMNAYGELQRTPGYTQDEAGNIIREGDYSANRWDPANEQKLQLTDDERTAMSGDPNKALEMYDPATTSRIANETSANMRGALSTGYDTQRDVAGQVAESQRGAIDPDALQMDAGVVGKMDKSAANVRAAIDPNQLGVSQSYLDKYPMSDAERQGYVDRATRQTGEQYRNLQRDLEIRAAQSGNASPLAVAAAKARLAQQSAVDQSDARANAELSAAAAQRETLQNSENTRLGANQTYAGLKSNSELSLGDQALNTEKTRLGAQQYLTGAQMQTEGNIAEQQLGIEDTNQARSIDVAAQAGAQAQAANQYNQNTGISSYQTADEQATARAAAIAGNRQGVSQYSQQQGYTQNMGVADALSRGNSTVADKRVAGQQELRGYLTGQQAQASNNVNTANSQRIENYGTMSGATNQSTQNKQNYELGKSSQGFTTALKKAAGGAIGSAVGGVFKP